MALEQLYTKEEIAVRLRISPSSIDRMIADEKFPRGIKATPQSIALWPESFIAAWELIHPHMTGGKDSPPAEDSGKKT